MVAIDSEIGSVKICATMGLTAKFVPANDLLAMVVRGTEKAPACCRGFLDL